MAAVVTPKAIRPYPVAYRVSNETCRKRKSRTAVVATSSPFKAQLAVAEEAKKKKKSGPELKKSKSVAKQNSSANTKPAKKRPRKSRSATVDSDNELCSYCGYQYGSPDDPLLEDEWYICTQCAKWYHENCGTLTKRCFKCYNCLPDK